MTIRLLIAIFCLSLFTHSALAQRDTDRENLSPVLEKADRSKSGKARTESPDADKPSKPANAKCANPPSREDESDDTWELKKKVWCNLCDSDDSKSFCD